MNGFNRLLVFSALAFLGFGVALTLTIIIAIWSDFESAVLWKAIGTLFVLFFFSGFLHVVAKGICEKPKGKD